MIGAKQKAALGNKKAIKGEQLHATQTLEGDKGPIECHIWGEWCTHVEL